MKQEIKIISLPMPYRLGSVNCYLIHAGENFLLVDTGTSSNRKQLEKELENAGCRPGNLKLITLTHGDFDHSGNAAYLREKFAVKIAMHADDRGMLEQGDMFWNRKKGSRLIRIASKILFGFGKSKRCTPDLEIQDGDLLTAYGFQGQILSIPGHSKGSIGILIPDGESETGQEKALLCGDLLDNVRRPGLNTIMDDRAAATASLEKLEELGIQTIYPGHGNPFLMKTLQIGHVQFA